MVERHGQIDAGVHEEAQPVVVVERQRAQPVEVGIRIRPLLRRIVAHRGFAAVLHPERHGALVIVRGDRHLLVVAAQADRRAGLRLLQSHQQLDHAAAVRAAVDVVAEEDPACRPAGGMGLARREEATQLVEAAVDIADREGEWRRDGRHGSDAGRGADGWRPQADAAASPPFYNRGARRRI